MAQPTANQILTLDYAASSGPCAPVQAKGGLQAATLDYAGGGGPAYAGDAAAGINLVAHPSGQGSVTAYLKTANVLFESFEAGVIPDTWTVTGTGFSVVAAGSNPTISPYAGSKMLQLNSYNRLSGCLTIPLNLSYESSPLDFTFWMSRDGAYDTNNDLVEVRIGSSATLETATTLGSFPRVLKSSALWEQKKVSIPPEYLGTSCYLFFNGIEANGDNIYFDQLAVAPSVPVPGTFTEGIENGFPVAWGRNPTNARWWYSATSGASPTLSPYAGTKLLTFCSVFAGNTTEALQIPVNLNGLTNSQLSFMMSRDSSYPDYDDRIEVKAGTTTVVADATLLATIHRYKNVAAQWELQTIAIPAGTSYIFINGISTGGSSIHFDAFELTGTVAATELVTAIAGSATVTADLTATIHAALQAQAGASATVTASLSTPPIAHLATSVSGGASVTAALTATDHAPLWRLNMTWDNGYQGICLGEVQMRRTVGGAQTCIDGTATGSYANGHPAYAVDGNTSTYYSTGKSYGWWAYTFPFGVDIVEYTITCALTGMSAPSEWTLERSFNGGATWQVMDTRTAQTGWSVGQTRTYSVASMAVNLEAAISGAGATTGSLTTHPQAHLGSTVITGVSVTAKLSTPAVLQSTIAAIATATGLLRTGVGLVAGCGQPSQATASLTAKIHLAAATKGQAAVAGALSATLKLRSVVASTASTTAQLHTAIPLASTISGTATVASPSLRTKIPLRSATHGTSSAEIGPLNTAIHLAGAVAGGASLEAYLFAAGSGFVADIPCEGATTGSLSTEIPLRGTLSAESSAAASVSTGIRLAAVAGGATSLAGVVTGVAAKLQGVISTLAAITGDLTGSIQLVSQIEAAATAQGEMITDIHLSVDTSGTATVTATLEHELFITAEFEGRNVADGFVGVESGFLFTGTDARLQFKGEQR